MDKTADALTVETVSGVEKHSMDKLMDLFAGKDREEREHFFEGAEKLLEVWFQPGEDGGAAKSLRDIPRSELDKLLEIAHCRILHSQSNELIDSYVLSESSMFVSDQRFILKTCGQTDLLSTVSLLIQLADKYAGLTAVTNVYYSRKNFLRPHLQPHLYKSFDQEIDHLDEHFKEGDAYCMGSLKDDRWYLYTMTHPQAPPVCADHSLEILMSDLPEDVMSIYSSAQCTTGRECTQRAGIMQLVPPRTIIHEELFEPVGYSMNGLVPNSDQYATIHVTPEKGFSYASFETNQCRECLFRQTLKVLDCFRPNRMILVLFSNDLSANGKETQTRIWQDGVPGYRRINLQFLRLQHDSLVYAQFARLEDIVSTNREIRRLIHGGEDDGDSNHEDSD